MLVRPLVRELNHLSIHILILILFQLSTTANAHISEGTNTLMRLSKTKVSLIYTLPTDNIKELKLETEDAITNAIRKGFQFSNNNKICLVTILGKKQLSGVDSTQFILDVSCKEAIKTLKIDYSLFLDKFSEHKNKTRIAIGSRSQSFEFSQDKQNHQIKLDELVKKWLKQKKSVQRRVNYQN